MSPPVNGSGTVLLLRAGAGMHGSVYREHPEQRVVGAQRGLIAVGVTTAMVVAVVMMVVTLVAMTH